MGISGPNPPRERPRASPPGPLCPRPQAGAPGPRCSRGPSIPGRGRAAPRGPAPTPPPWPTDRTAPTPSPRPEPLGEAAPRGAGLGAPEDGDDEGAVVLGGHAGVTRLAGGVLDAFPGVIRDLVATHRERSG